MAASVRIFTSEKDATFISTALGVKASRIHIRGEPVSKRNPKGPAYPETAWIYDAPIDAAVELGRHIADIVNFLELRRADLDAIRDRITTMDMFCMFSSENGQGSAELDAGLLQRLAALRLDLIIDLYPPSKPISSR